MYIHHLKNEIELSRTIYQYSIDRLVAEKFLIFKDGHYVLTNRANQVLKLCYSLFLEEGKLVQQDEFDEFISKYRELFPVSKRAHKKVIKDKFLKFFKDYDYDYDLILNVTSFYIKQLQDAGTPEYIQRAEYFIEKNKSSNLLNVISQYEDSKTKNALVKQSLQTRIINDFYSADD